MFSQRLREARKRKSITQTQLAEAVGVSHSAPGQWERGVKEPTLSNLHNVAKVLDCSVGWLLGSGSSIKPQSRDAILTDVDTAPGLRQLAADTDLIHALDIQPGEWAALRSLDSPLSLDRDGYISLLLLIRAYAA